MDVSSTRRIVGASGRARARPLEDDRAALLIARVDFIEFSLPYGQLLIFAIAAVVVGVVAAIFPARRAARLQPRGAPVRVVRARPRRVGG